MKGAHAHIKLFDKTVIAVWIYFWHISLIQQSRNVSKNKYRLDVDRKNVTRKSLF